MNVAIIIRSAAIACVVIWSATPCIAQEKAVTTSQTKAGESPFVIDLPTALRLAGAQNLDIQISREKIAEAQANHESALWRYFPSMSAGVAYRRHDDLTQDVSGNIVDVHKESYTVGPTLGFQLDIGEAMYNNLVARQLVSAAESGAESQRLQSELAAAQGYFDLARGQAAVAVAKESVHIAEDYVAQVQRAVTAGITFKADALRAEVQAEKSRVALRKTEEQQRVAGARLAQTLHLDSVVTLVAAEGDPVPLELIPSEATADRLIAQAISNRPELQQNRALLDAAEAGKKAAKYAPLFPSVGAQVFVGGFGGDRTGAPGDFGGSEDYAVTVGWRIGQGGLFDQGRRHASEARLRLAELDRERLYDEIRRQVIEGFTHLQSVADQMEMTRRTIDAADEMLRLTQQRKEFAVGVVLENIQAVQELTSARLEYVNAVAEYNKAQYALNWAVGGSAGPKQDTGTATPTPR